MFIPRPFLLVRKKLSILGTGARTGAEGRNRKASSAAVAGSHDKDPVQELEQERRLVNSIRSTTSTVGMLSHAKLGSVVFFSDSSGFHYLVRVFELNGLFNWYHCHERKLVFLAPALLAFGLILVET